MLICVYDTANEAEILKAKITQIATAAYRRIAYRVCQRYESFAKECKTADLIIVLADGADGMDGVIAAKNADRDGCRTMRDSGRSHTGLAVPISTRSRYRLKSSRRHCISAGAWHKHG